MTVKLSGHISQEIIGRVVEVKRKRAIIEVEGKEYTLRTGQPFIFTVHTEISPK